jgi:mRNA interferase RelE/StbE
MIKYHKQAEKFILSQDKNNATRLSAAIRQLPLGDVKRLHGTNKLQKYRLRVGDYRIVFCMEHDDIIILRIDNRGDVYKRI